MTSLTASQLDVSSAQATANGGTLFHQIWKRRTSYFLLAPFLVLFLIFVVFPIGASAYLSLTEFKGTKPPVYKGFDENFGALLALDLKELTLAVDKTTGEQLYRCDRKNIPQSQVAAAKEAGQTCEIAYSRPAEVLNKGFRELGQFNLLGRRYTLGASDARFWTALWNTLRYSLIVVPLGIIFGLGLALALQRQSSLNYVLRTIFFLPSVTSTIAIATIWRYIFSSENYGLINGVLTQFGIAPITFLANPDWTMPVLVLMALWGGMGYNMILFLAGLQSISGDLYEAAAIDGASQRQRLWQITIPMLRPTLLYVLVTGTISAMQIFDAVYVVLGSVERIGGVLDSGLTVVPYLYDTGFANFKLGYAAAIAWVLFMIIFGLTVLNLRLGRVNEPV